MKTVQTGLWVLCVVASSHAAVAASTDSDVPHASDLQWDVPEGQLGEVIAADQDPITEPEPRDLPFQLLDVLPPETEPTTRTTAPTSRQADPAASRPESHSADASHFPSIVGTYGLEEFFHHFAPYEPMYFVGGWKAPQIKFNLSIRYQFFTTDGPLATKYPLFKGFNFAYSQTSLWDWSDPNNPFFKDTSYRPEFFYYLENLPHQLIPPGSQVGLQAGIGHESNGVLPPNHRSLNILYLRPIFTLGDPNNDLFLTVAPKCYIYIGDISLNPDLPQYRGYCDIRAALGQRDGLQLACIGRVGSHFDKGSAQVDLTYPLTKILGGNVDVSVDAQYFIGYGDSLLTYNQYTQVFRIGLALVR